VPAWMSAIGRGRNLGQCLKPSSKSKR
jgi:hypothetical protein